MHSVPKRNEAALLVKFWTNVISNHGIRFGTIRNRQMGTWSNLTKEVLFLLSIKPIQEIGLIHHGFELHL